MDGNEDIVRAKTAQIQYTQTPTRSHKSVVRFFPCIQEYDRIQFSQNKLYFRNRNSKIFHQPSRKHLTAHNNAGDVMRILLSFGKMCYMNTYLDALHVYDAV